jgi:hypothetical protein
VYVTGAPRANSSVVVLDFPGKVTKVIRGLPGATGMALVEDGSLLYVTLQTQRAIAVVDTKRFRRTRVFRLPAAAGCPDSVAWSGKRVWFGSFPLGPGDGLPRSVHRTRACLPATRLSNRSGALRNDTEATEPAHRGGGAPPAGQRLHLPPRARKAQAGQWSPQKTMQDIALTREGTRFVMTTAYPLSVTTFAVNDHRPCRRGVVFGGSPKHLFVITCEDAHDETAIFHILRVPGL